MTRETYNIELRGTERRARLFCDSLESSLNDQLAGARAHRQTDQAGELLEALKAKRPYRGGVRLTLPSVARSPMVEQFLSAARLWGLDVRTSTQALEEGAQEKAASNTRWIGGLKFEALRYDAPRPHWRVRTPGGEVLGPGAAGLKNHSRPALWQGLEDLHNRVGTERFVAEFAAPDTRLYVELTEPQRMALWSVERVHGPGWKQALANLWAGDEAQAEQAVGADQWQALREIRNRHGQAWLESVTPRQMGASEDPGVTEYEAHRREQLRFDRAHERAYALDVPQTNAAQAAFEAGESSIEQFEAALYEAEQTLARHAARPDPSP